MATGELRDAGGRPLGAVAIIHRGFAQFEIELPDSAGAAGTRPFPALTDSPSAPERCAQSTGYQTALGSPEQWMLVFSEPTGDPSYWTHLLMVDYDSPGDCYLPVLATAALVWTVPSVRPWIAVDDGGETGGARGGVLAVDGKPIAYRTAPGDAWSAIAQRFGLAPDDLEYLNPQRSRAGSGEAVAYQILNLDVAGRGGSVERLPGGPLATSEEFA